MKKNNRPLIIIILVFILELAVIGVLGVTCLKRVNSIEKKNSSRRNKRCSSSAR